MYALEECKGIFDVYTQQRLFLKFTYKCYANANGNKISTKASSSFRIMKSGGLENSLGCAGSTARWVALVSKVGSLALCHNPGLTIMVFTSFFGPEIPGAARPVIFVNFGLRDFLAYISWMGSSVAAREEW